MALFDFNVGIGRGAGPVGGAFRAAADLLETMDRFGIAEALVYHRVAAEADVELGNRLLLEELEGQGRLYGCWMMAPPTLGDLPNPESWVNDALACGVRAVRLTPAFGLYALADWCAGPMLAALEAVRMPVLLDFGEHHWSEQVIPWQDVKTVCDMHPDLPVVVAGATVGDARDAVAVLHRAPNCHLELHAFVVADGLMLLAKEGLTSQLVFGTGMPARAGECPVAQHLLSGLASAEAAAAGAGNARRLLRLDGPAPEASAPAIDRPHPVVDAHAHCGAWERTITTVRTPETILASMDRCGVDVLIASSFTAIQGEMQAGNDQTADAIRNGEGRIFGYCGLNPHWPDEIEDELVRCFEQAGGFVGLKLHCNLHEAALDHPGYGRALRYADEHGLPVLVHGGGDRDTWEPVAAGHPNAAFISAHACAWDGYDSVDRTFYAMAREVENIYLDVAGSAVHRGALRALVDLVGVDKVLYGSDFPMFDLAYELGRVTLSDLTPAEKSEICGGNALRLFSRVNVPRR